MANDDLIRRGDALAAVHEADSLELTQHGESRIAERIAALPAATDPKVTALVDALKLALDYVEGCKANNLPDLGAASALPLMDDVLRVGEAALAALRKGRPA